MIATLPPPRTIEKASHLARRPGCGAFTAAQINNEDKLMLDQLLGRLRPKTDDAAAIRSAMAATDTAIVAAEASVKKLRAERGDALLAGGQQAAKHEAALREATDEAERLNALSEALGRRLADAERREAHASLEAAIEEARAAVAAFSAFRDREYPELAAKVAAGLALEQRAQAAIAGAARLHQAMGDDRPDVRLPSIEVPIDFQPFGFGAAVVLPNPAGGAPIWPARR